MPKYKIEWTKVVESWGERIVEAATPDEAETIIDSDDQGDGDPVTSKVRYYERTNPVPIPDAPPVAVATGA